MVSVVSFSIATMLLSVLLLTACIAHEAMVCTMAMSLHCSCVAVSSSVMISRRPSNSLVITLVRAGRSLPR